MSKNKNVILYIVATQYDNLGDLLINKCLLSMLCKYGKVYVDTKNVPKHFKNILLGDSPNLVDLKVKHQISFKGLGILSIPFRKNLNFSHVFKSPGPFGSSKSSLDKIRSTSIFLIFYLFQHLGAKGYFVGNDYIVSNKFDIFILKKFSSILSEIQVRSHINVKEISFYGVDNVKYIPDLCFAFKSKIVKNVKSKICISFRDLADEEWDIQLKRYIKTIIRFFSKENFQIEFFYQVERDMSYNKGLYDFFKKDFSSIKFRNDVINWNDIENYSNAKFVVSNRLHVLLLGQNYGAIPIAVLNNSSKTVKIRNIFETIGLHFLIYNQIVYEDLQLLTKNYFDICQKISLVNQDQYNIIVERFNSIFSD